MDFPVVQKDDLIGKSGCNVNVVDGDAPLKRLALDGKDGVRAKARRKAFFANS